MLHDNTVMFYGGGGATSTTWRLWMRERATRAVPDAVWDGLSRLVR